MTKLICFTHRRRDGRVVEFMLLKNGASLTRQGSMKRGGKWLVKAGDVTAEVEPRSWRQRTAQVTVRSRSRMVSGQQSGSPTDFLKAGRALTDGADRLGATLYATPSWHGRRPSKKGLTTSQSTARLDRVYRAAGFAPDFSSLKRDLRDAASMPRPFRRSLLQGYKTNPELVRRPRG